MNDQGALDKYFLRKSALAGAVLEILPAIRYTDAVAYTPRKIAAQRWHGGL